MSQAARISSDNFLPLDDKLGPRHFRLTSQLVALSETDWFRSDTLLALSVGQIGLYARPMPFCLFLLDSPEVGQPFGYAHQSNKVFHDAESLAQANSRDKQQPQTKKQIERPNMKSTPTSNASNPKTGLGALLTPENSALILIDHQPFQFAGLRSHDTQTIINNVVGLAKSAKAFGVPTLLTTVIEKQGGYILKPLQDVFPEQKPIDRTFINTWEDARVVDWVKKSGRTKIVMAALWTEICLAMPVIQALGEGYEVYIVTDASGAVSLEAHEMAIQRMIQAGAIPITWMVFAAELQRDWARTDTAAAVAQILVEHAGVVGTTFMWEQQLLATPHTEKKVSAA